MAENEMVLTSNGFKIIWGIVIRVAACYMLFGLFECMDGFLLNIIYGLMVIVIVIFLFVTALPIKIVMSEEGITYKRFGFKEKNYLYKWMYSSKEAHITWSVFIFLFSKFVILLKDEEGNKTRLYCGSLAEKDFNRLLEVFATYGNDHRQAEKAEQKMSFRTSNNILFQETIDVPKDIIVKKSTFVIKCVMGGIALIFFCNFIHNIYLEWKSTPTYFENLILSDVLFVLLIGILLLLIFYTYPILCWYRIAKENRKIPRKILLYNEFFKVDEAIYYFEHIDNGSIVAPQYTEKRIMIFDYKGEKIEYYFGKNRDGQEYFEKYEIMADYFFNKGFAIGMFTQ